LDQFETVSAEVTQAAEESLRILLVINLPWNVRLGAVRVYMELAEQWRAAGHIVDHFSMSDAFPSARESRAGFALRQVLFGYKAAAFVKRNRRKYDVIDALIGSLPASKEKLKFNGLLVARSVGLYRLYDRFERGLESPRSWPRRPRGTFLGRILYTMIGRWRMHCSDKAVQHADLINLPNEDEAACVRQEIASEHPIVVQPYGLTNERRHALFHVAAPASDRLAKKKISFIGMWSARKGAYDWGRILRRIWQEIPDARFCFLGTMVESCAILPDLGLEGSNKIEFVPDYAPASLPKLLADCAVGAFPSYVEGFGLAVLEQLAATVPTVAFDVPGPRDILQSHLPELLVPRGDIDGFASAICKILRLDEPSYRRLAERSVEAAAQFRWSKISRETLQAYRRRLHSLRNTILFVQPFSLGWAGGGARILRALLTHAPMGWHSLCCSPQRPEQRPNETHLRSRPFWGRIETSRLAILPKMTTPIFASGFRWRLKEFCRSRGVCAIHTIPHAGLDFAQAHEVARELSLPFFISLHDDVAYTAASTARPGLRETLIRRAWLEAQARFVISEPLGREYSSRYGARDYQVVTDGLNELTPRQYRPEPGRFELYFMGLFHVAYERNLRALLEGVAIFERRHPGVIVKVTCRCEHIRPHVFEDIKEVNVLPFANEAQIDRDLEKADLLYMPIPFGEEHENFARYSVSTKMVTYAGSGRAILYHGPTGSAAFDLLKRNNAAIFLTSLSPEEIARSLAQITDVERAKVAANGLALARREFMLSDQTRKFWGTISRFVALP
jgi:glycosyltransferase involved in cell wall biosynthesis